MRLKKKYRNIEKFKKIDNWINENKINKVLYFCNTKHQVSTLLKYTTNKDIYFTTYNSFNNNWEDTKLVNLKKDLIKFKDL